MSKKTLLPVGVIILVWLIIIVFNFSPGTWIVGWDNLLPELNLALNFKRALFSVWQEYQGLGLLGGMGHAADLPRLLVLWLWSFLLPMNWLRQAWFALMLLLGPIGAYLLISRILPAKRMAGFIGACFYLLNLATVQQFYLPFETFVTHFGFLPWLLWSALLLLDRMSFKRAVIFVVISFFSVPQAYVPTVFIVYCLALGIILAADLISTRAQNWRHVLAIVVMTFAVNAFWLLPFLYFSLFNSGIVVQAKINQMATENTYLQNRAFGTLLDVAMLRGFWFNLGDYGKFIFVPWRDHLDSLLVWFCGLSVFLTVLGGIWASFRSKSSYRWGFFGVFLFTVTILANATPVFSQIDGLLYQLPLVSQVFRSPFTKFSILLALLNSVYLSFFVAAVLGRLNLVEGELRVVLKTIVVAGIMTAMIIVVWPVFSGHMFSEQERLKMPREYLQTFEFFESVSPNSRIANFPQHTYWGWQKYSWGNSGSGFLWYGTSQPILDRAFDVWSAADENYYWEISYALYSKNLSLFENVLEKYRVNWLLLDENVVNPSSPKALYIEELKALISQSSKFKEVANFGKISIYSVSLAKPTKDFVSIASGLPNIGPAYRWGNLDQGFVDLGDYEQGDGVVYPNRTLFSGKRLEDLEFNPQDIPVVSQITVNSENRKCSQNGFDQTGKTTACAVFFLPELAHERAYLVSVDSKNISGQSLVFWVENLNSRRSDLETYLPKSQIADRKSQSYYVLPPMEVDGIGYSLHFDNVSSQNEKTDNELGKVSIGVIDYWKLVSQRSQAEYGGNVQYLSTESFNVSHPNPIWYQIDLTTSFQGQTLILAQSYESGWVAWDQDFRFLEHKKVNNWANGWILEENSRNVYVLFWPQILEFAGFGVLAILLVTFCLKLKSW